jgi:hypothetical protein
MSGSFGGVMAFFRSPTEGVWKQSNGQTPMKIPSLEGWRVSAGVGPLLNSKPTPGPDGPCPSREGNRSTLHPSRHEAFSSVVAPQRGMKNCEEVITLPVDRHRTVSQDGERFELRVVSNAN